MSEENNDSMKSDEVTAAANEASSPTTETPSVEVRLQSELEAVKNELLYLRAEFETFKQRRNKERSDLLKYGAENAFSEILNVTDNFDRALGLAVTPENTKSFQDGIRMIYSSLLETLKRFGVEEVPAEGKPFDPHVHEAIGAEPRNDIPPNHVSKVLRKPYKLFDRVIRPAQVIISQEHKGES